MRNRLLLRNQIPILLSLFLNKSTPAQLQQEDAITYNLPLGFQRVKIFSKTAPDSGALIATFFKMENSPAGKIKFISRKTFQGVFGFRAIEDQCRRNNQQIVLQVAAAFTPDWKVIEGFALQKGKRVGQDAFIGQNTRLIYQGIMRIKNGKPGLFHSEKIENMMRFVSDAIRDSCDLFQQAFAIIDGEINKKMDLPGVRKRRFFIEIIEGDIVKFGVVSFLGRMLFADAVAVLKSMENEKVQVKNAIYLDMGSVAEGYFYDAQGRRYLTGNAGKDINRYTNFLVFYKDLN
ncbi:MAG: hypothetical protein DWQ05_20900 [Calditrichaeota bacterium]|nr:MAG: hypothetical protein DWQ05_20900 [Calditrichota bacterium]